MLYMFIYVIYVYVQSIDLVFANGVEGQGSILDRIILNSKKWYFISPYLMLSIIGYVSTIELKNPGKEVPPPIHLGVVAIEKEAFGLTTVANFPFLFILYIYYIVICLVGWLVGWLVDFYGISTLVGYLMPYPFYTYILNILNICLQIIWLMNK